MITAVWLSPVGDQLAIQIDEEEIVIVDSAYEGTTPCEDVPGDWSPLYDITDTTGSDT